MANMKVWSQHQIQCLQAMGISRWQLKQNNHAENNPQSVDPLVINKVPNQLLNKQGVDENRVNLASSSSWSELNQAVVNCTACGRSEHRKQAILGEGNQQANIFIIGDAPTQADDQAGATFSGEAGALFTKMLAAININRDATYISNFVKCHQPNASVTAQEAHQCLPYLQQQIDKVQPSLLLVFGESAAQYLLANHSPIELLRQQVHSSINQIKTIVSYSPQVVLDDVSKKRAVLEDLKLAQKTLSEHGINV